MAMKRSVLLLVAALLVGALAAPASASGAGWSITPSPNPSVPTGQLFWVSCPAVNSCMAVGTFVTTSGTGVTLAEQWNGISWRILPTPNPQGTAVSGLLGVACTAPSACTAVGSNLTTTGASHALAERWDGTSWSIQATANPPQGGGTLNGVSCTSASACTAVGASSAGTLAERWDGASWTIQVTSNPPQGGGFLSGVSCTSASACTAVGASNPFTPNAVTLAERWDGTSWSIQATANPPQGGGGLAGVSCTSASACTAVGASNAGILAERWDGASWAIQPAPAPAGAQSPFLNSVVCTSASACTAAGAYTNSSGANKTLAERWDGTAWHLQATPNPAGTSQLIGVACTSGTACTAVGYSNTAQTPAAVAERWNGSAWKVQAAPNPPGAASSIFFGVACTAPSGCIAVGATTSKTRAPATLAERWDGTHWAIQPTPNPPQGGGLNGVSCTSAWACTAVGNSGAGTLAERWDGTHWAIQPTPNPSGQPGSFLNSVACTSASFCTAVGSQTDNSGNPVGTLAERWDGTHWAIQHTPNPSGPPGSFLNSVACSSASFCIAVGGQIDSAGNSVGTLAEVWDGTRWAIQPAPSLPPGGGLAAVSCTSMVACTAVGSLSGPSSSGPTTLAERWDGTKWSVQPTPGLSGGQGGLFNGVACQASACTAVGLSITSSAPLILAERWDGTRWTIQPTPSPVGASDINPPAVACPSLSACTAVTGYANNGPKVTLAEQWSDTGQAVTLPASTSAAPIGLPAAYLRAVLLQPRSVWGRTPVSYRR
jgi:hypothetical protein